MRAAEKSLLRIIDANYNRAKEAIRVAEEVSRFHLREARLTARLKRVRHDLTQALLRLKIPYRRLLEVRNSKEDVGRASFIRDKRRSGWRDLVLSNLKRAQEAMRVLEEVSKMGVTQSSASFQRIRFRLYELEKEALRQF